MSSIFLENIVENDILTNNYACFWYLSNLSLLPEWYLCSTINNVLWLTINFIQGTINSYCGMHCFMHACTRLLRGTGVYKCLLIVAMIYLKKWSFCVKQQSFTHLSANKYMSLKSKSKENSEATCLPEYCCFSELAI